MRLSLILVALFVFSSANLRAELPRTELPATVAAGRGVIEGTVTYQPDAKRPWRYSRYYVKNRKNGQLAEAVVAISGGGLKRTAEAAEPQTHVVNQKDFRFDPETIAIRAGDSVKFRNSDNGVHNVRANHALQSFNVNMLSGREHIESFPKAGGLQNPYRIGCDYHSSMRAWIFVIAHPYFQITGPDGKFRLNNVPPGEYTIDVAHPAGEFSWSGKVAVTADQVTQLDIRLTPDDKSSTK